MQTIGLLILLASPASVFALSSVSVRIETMESAAGQARNVTLDYQLGNRANQSQPALKLKGQIKASGDKQWADVSLACAALSSPQAGQWRCENGKLITERINVPFSLALTVKKTSGLQQIAAELALRDARFSDAAGLHAGEKVTGKMTVDATQQSRAGLINWRWQTAVDWASGEVFWQPFYFASGGHQLQASGLWNQQLLTIESANLNLNSVGQMKMNGQLRWADKKIQALDLAAPSLDLEALYPLLLKPVLEKTALNNLEMAGKAGLSLIMQNGEPTSFRVDLHDVDIDDKNGRFALYKVNASLPWDYDAARQLSLNYAGGRLLKLPLGAANLGAELNRYSLTANQLKLPVLDGTLTLADVSAAWVEDQWHWHLRANISPITMSEFSHALGWPLMQGKVSAMIPLVTYTGGNLTTDGAMLFNVFEGTAAVTNLAMQTPLGLAPRLTADIQMRNLDLGTLTRTFSFGVIEGKLDGDVNNLELANWKPVKFDAALRSSPGRYPKKISQRAVENISALGGAGAAAAIQRSFLRFFKEFNYAKIGLSCRLRNDVCKMDGIESTQQGYIIVKGSGVPAITVLGYNHNVSWGELLSRVKRITAENAKPVIK